MNINGLELIIIIAVALMVFGPKELPKIGTTIGTAVREFRKASQGFTKELGLDEIIEDESKRVKDNKQELIDCTTNPK